MFDEHKIEEVKDTLMGFYQKYFAEEFPEGVILDKVDEFQDPSEVWIYCTIKNSGVLEELTLFWIISDQHTIREDVPLTERILTNKVLMNPWDFYEKGDRNKETRVSQETLLRKYRNCVISMIDDGVVDVGIYQGDDMSMSYSLEEWLNYLNNRLSNNNTEVEYL